MKIPLLLLGVSSCALLFTACEDDVYGPRHVSVSAGAYSPYYDAGYDEYSPYYSYGGRRYYQSEGRYVYYTDRRPYYVTSLPTGANYITPDRRRREVISDGYRRNDAVYRTTVQRRPDGYDRGVTVENHSYDRGRASDVHRSSYDDRRDRDRVSVQTQARYAPQSDVRVRTQSNGDQREWTNTTRQNTTRNYQQAQVSAPQTEVRHSSGRGDKGKKKDKDKDKKDE